MEHLIVHDQAVEINVLDFGVKLLEHQLLRVGIYFVQLLQNQLHVLGA